jgi:hypothetical protein
VATQNKRVTFLLEVKMQEHQTRSKNNGGNKMFQPEAKFKVKENDNSRKTIPLFSLE